MPDKTQKDRDEKSQEGLGPISRRDFAIGSVAILGVTGGDGASGVLAQTPGKAAGQALAGSHAIAVQPASESARSIKLTVNGWKYEIKVEPEAVLRDVLREQLGFLSVKDMCNGYGACGSCTVIVNGRPVLSCMTLACECDNVNIETAEGVATANSKLIDAYVLNHCMQCGYCTPGFVVTAKALLDRNPKPKENEIREALGGNICRCGTYPQHILAVQEASSGK